MIGSQQCSWWSVHDFVLPKLELVDGWPLVGSPAWVDLEDRSRIKWAALLDAARHWALRLETCQQAQADASKEIAASADWSVVAQRIARGRGAAYIPRKGVA